MCRHWSRHLNYSEDKKMKDDPAIAKIREVRHRISAEHDHDPRKVVEYYIEMQKQYRERLVERSADEEKHNQPVEVG